MTLFQPAGSADSADLAAQLAAKFDDGFEFNGKRTAFGDVKTVDRSKWEKKGIVKVDGITLDAWHHVGVREFEKRLAACGK